MLKRGSTARHKQSGKEVKIISRKVESHYVCKDNDGKRQCIKEEELEAIKK